MLQGHDYTDIYLRDLSPTIREEVIKMISKKKPELAKTIREGNYDDLIVGGLFDVDDFELIG